MVCCDHGPRSPGQGWGFSTVSQLAFTAAEFAARDRQIRLAVSGRGLDLLLITRGENIFYACGYRASHFASWLSEFHALVVPAEGPPRLIARALERGVAMEQWSPRPVLYQDHEDPYVALKTIADELGRPMRTIGIEERFLKVSQMRRLSATFPHVSFVDVSGLVAKIAGRPSAAETACMRQAARVTEIGFQAGLAALSHGVSAGQVIGQMHEAMYRAGQRDFDMALVCVWAGPEGGLMHDTRADRVIRTGDVATIEVWGVDNQYKAGAQASVFIGSDPPPAIVEAYDLVTAMYRAACDRVRAGVTAGDVFDAANAIYRGARGSDYYRRCGGSMGLTIFTIDLVRGRRDPLMPGMCLLIQTLVDDPVLLTCAGTVLVTESGHEELTAVLPRLKTIPARA